MTQDTFDAPAIRPELEQIRAAMDGIDISASRVASSLSRAFSDAIVRGKSFDDVLRGLASRLSALALDAALKPLTQGIGSLVSGAAGAMSSLTVTPFADGGIVASPTFFGMQGGLGLMGERGAEAIVPLARGPDGRLGLASAPAVRQPSIVVNIQTPDAESFRRSESQWASGLARAVARGHRGL